VKNNPLIYTDPSGELFVIDDLIVAAVVWVAEHQLATAIITGVGSVLDAWNGKGLNEVQIGREFMEGFSIGYTVSGICSSMVSVQQWFSEQATAKASGLGFEQAFPESAGIGRGEYGLDYVLENGLKNVDPAQLVYYTETGKGALYTATGKELFAFGAHDNVANLSDIAASKFFNKGEKLSLKIDEWAKWLKNDSTNKSLYKTWTELGDYSFRIYNRYGLRTRHHIHSWGIDRMFSDPTNGCIRISQGSMAILNLHTVVYDIKYLIIY